MPSATAPRRSLSADDVACWLLKTSLHPAELVDGWLPGQEVTLRRCVRPTYRLDLMEPGQRCVLWLSGTRDPGVHAVGRLAGDPVSARPPDGRPAVEVALTLLARHVPRRDLVDDHDFAGAEVITLFPVGANPSYLGGTALAVLASASAEVAALL